jgi:hypothetical protein
MAGIRSEPKNRSNLGLALTGELQDGPKSRGRNPLLNVFSRRAAPNTDHHVTPGAGRSPVSTRFDRFFRVNQAAGKVFATQAARF